MDEEQIKHLNQQVRELRHATANGQIFKQLDRLAGDLIEQTPRHPRTPIATVEDDAAFYDELRQMYKKLQDDQLDQVSDVWLLSLLDHFKVDDPAIRLNGCLMIFNALLANDLLTNDQLRLSFHYLAQNDILLAHIDEPKNRAVFGRATALSALASLLYADRAGYFFLQEYEVDRLVDLVSIILVMEKDTRGFVGEQGWAHMYAELVNVLGELSQREELVRGDKVSLMALLLANYSRLTTPLIMGENEQLADYLVNLMNQHQVYRRYFLLALRNWRLRLQAGRPQNAGNWHQIFNYRRLMQCLLMVNDLPEQIGKVILEQDDQNE